MTEAELKYAPDTDIAFWDKCTASLTHNRFGIDGAPIPYSCGAHSLRAMRMAISTAQPKNILEIGFNVGHSASVWLNLFDGELHSCDISHKTETKDAVKLLHAAYPDRFFYYHVYKNTKRNEIFNAAKFEMAFIDGGHMKSEVVYDILECIDWGIKYLFFDDVLEQYGDVKEAISYFGRLLIPAFQIGNMALYESLI